MQKSEITKYLEKRVYYNDSPYILAGVTIRRNYEDKTKLMYLAELRDVKQQNSILIVDLYNVKTV